MLMDKTESISFTNISNQERKKVDGLVVRELPLRIFLNGRELVTTLCSPIALDYLAAGILVSEGLLNNKQEIKRLSVDMNEGLVEVETAEDRQVVSKQFFKPLIASGGGKGASSFRVSDLKDDIQVDSNIKVSVGEISTLIRNFLDRSSVYKVTRGVHSAAFCDNQRILIFHDDIGRHNAIDKVFGECLLTDITLDKGIIITSGRISSEILLKVAKRKIPILISKAAPTNLGVRLGNSLGITITRFMINKGINIYSHDWRVVADDGK
jgi:FdhD protein